MRGSDARRDLWSDHVGQLERPRVTERVSSPEEKLDRGSLVGVEDDVVWDRRELLR